ncbi:MAG: hypothetical protein ACLP3C_28135 [Mycobacterium sp.]|uniref:hypothetical protein n=1 Tax=Mycobacterium sp. TaxID=1785 RepID=UPI003F960C90
MSLVAKGSRHVAVAVPEVRVRRGIAVSLRQQGVTAADRCRAWRIPVRSPPPQVINGRLRFVQVSPIPSAQQSLYQNGGGRPMRSDVAGAVIRLERSPRQFDRAVDIMRMWSR